MSRIVMVIGGSSSGKSVFAEEIVHRLQNTQSCPVTYVATGTIWDDEFAKRVEKHKIRRPKNWGIIEEPRNLHQALVNKVDEEELFLIDGIGTWVTNIMYFCSSMGKEDPQEFSWKKSQEDEFKEFLGLFMEACKKFNGTIIMVADEVGMDVIPYHKEGRVFRDLNGMANQKLAKCADEVYLVVCGIPMQIK
ncbi:MAG: hypothetical protein APF76_00480 [Desulfitibacter sp. BRH_c19]|nr:MAG: hypothetical protein APF76_00480 [Desulfitibacter sp. BRH_c19]